MKNGREVSLNCQNCRDIVLVDYKVKCHSCGKINTPNNLGKNDLQHTSLVAKKIDKGMKKDFNEIINNIIKAAFKAG